MLSAAENPSRKPIICYVTDGKSLGAGDRAGSVLARIQAAVEAGADWVQIREKDMPERELLDLARAAVRAAGHSRAGAVRVVVNDRLDIAVAAGAAGVHLGRESLPASEAARWCRAGNASADFLVGVSCHSIEEAREAEEAGASYIFFGPVFETPSKKSYGSPQGLAKLGEVCNALQIPTVAIGGINADNAEACLRAGAAGIAAIRMFQEPLAAAGLKSAIEGLHDAR